MKQKHVITLYYAWEENRLGKEERRTVEEHLAACRSCGRYYEKMSLLLHSTDPSLLPRLDPDPFLPTRIRATERGGEPLPDGVLPAGGTPGTGKPLSPDGTQRTSAHRGMPGWLRLGLAGTMLVVAVAVGAYFGNELATITTSQSTDGDSQIVTAYYEAVAQTSFASDWGDVIEQTEEDPK